MRIIVFCCFVSTCLASSTEKRIVNGSPSFPFVHTHQASIQIRLNGIWTHHCGGVLIARNKILTAAHCFKDLSAPRMRVVVGAHNLYEDNAYEQTVGVRMFVVHGENNAKLDSYPNDIGIIYLASSVTLNDNVQIASLAPKGSSFVDTQCVITGWGLTSGFGSNSATLMEANITKITTDQCQFKWPKKKINIKQICVYEEVVSSGNPPSACDGDSGGPMMCGANRELLAGISSFGDENCRGDFPSVYTRVSEYLDWIARMSEYLDWIASN